SYLLIRHRVESLCTCSVWCVLLERVFSSWESTLNAGTGETRYSECRDRGDQI
ncbi:unnamed protein product, partial [Staurois parvus]